MTKEVLVPTSVERATWEKPEVRRIDASGAEFGGSVPSGDTGTSKS